MSPTVERQDLRDMRQCNMCYSRDLGETRMRTMSLPTSLELSVERAGKVRFRSESSIVALKDALGLLKTELLSSQEEDESLHTLDNWKWWEKTIQRHDNGEEDSDDVYDEDNNEEESYDSGDSVDVDNEFFFSSDVEEKISGRRVQGLIKQYDQGREPSKDVPPTNNEIIKNKVVPNIISSVAKKRKCKSLRFADTLGEDLTRIKYFEDDIPVIPLSAYKNLEGIDPNDYKSHPHYTKTTFFVPRPHPSPSPTTSLLPMFILPPVSPLHADPDLAVRLESVDPSGASVEGMIRLTNLHPKKTVEARWTTDGWKTQRQADGHFVPGSARDGVTELFTFQISPQNIPVGGRLEFCLRAKQAGREFWDNNSGRNYVLQAFTTQRQTGFNIEDYL